MKLSACLIIYNEEKRITRSLESLKGLVDEIIVVHDGEPADRALELCRKYTDKIFVRPHCGFMEAHLPFCLNQAAGEWILRLDADEFLSEELKNNLAGLLSGEQADAYEFSWPIYDGKKYLTTAWPRKLSLFRKNKVAFLGLVHFTPQINGVIKKSDYKIMHQPDYDNFSWACFKTKWSKWAKLQASNYFKDFSLVAKYNYQSNDWPKKIIWRKRWPLLFAPVEFLTIFLKTLTSGGSSYLIGYKIALLNALYRLLVNYHIFLIKKGQ